ncbi:MAG: VanW family protein [Myxococcota bacterium]
MTGRSKRWRWGAAAAVVLGAGAFITWDLQPPPPPPAPVPAVPPPVRVAGTPLPLEGDPGATALDLVRRYAGTPITLTFPGGDTREVVPAALGAEIDRVRLAELVADVLDPDSGLRRQAARRARAEDAIDLPVPIRVDPERSVTALLPFKDDVDRVATSAAVDLEKKQLVPEREGFRMDVYATAARLEAAIRTGASRIEAAGEVIAPRLRAAELGNVVFDHVLGYFETRYNRSARYADRTFNLRLAASRLDGTVLRPGEVFDFNETVGPRDEANGYRVAPVIAQGELVDGIGGGTCQVSGTLHGAAFFAGLEVVERVPHTRPSSYIQLGMDAAVAFPSINFRVRNDFDFPVVLHQVVKGGRVRAEVLGPPRERTVSFFRRVDEAIPFDVVERETDALPEGKRQLSQRGVPGFDATVFRLVREGRHAVRTKTVTRYPPTTQIVWVGTGPDDARGKVNRDGSLEYTADEYLVITQGPDIRDGEAEPPPGGGTSYNRVRGKTGTAGWQAEAGMPVFEDER